MHMADEPLNSLDRRLDPPQYDFSSQACCSGSHCVGHCHWCGILDTGCQLTCHHRLLLVPLDPCYTYGTSNGALPIGQ